MCYEGQCCVYVPVENGCLVFAVISAVVTGIATLACLILGILFESGAIVAFQYARQTEFPEAAQLKAAAAAAAVLTGIIILLVGIASLIAFIFSVLLCNGICKRRPGQVKAYFIYGVAITVLAVLAASVELALQGPIVIGVSTLLGCALYCMFLILVHQTYYKILHGVIKDHMRLVEADITDN